MNTLYELGNKVRMILRTRVAITIDNINYMPNDIYTVMDNCSVRFMYRDIEKSMQAKNNVQAYSTGFPTALVIDIPKVTPKILNLCTTKSNNITYTESENAIADNKTLCIMNIPNDNSLLIYTKNGIKINHFTFDKSNLLITSDDFINGEQYNIFYTLNANTVFDMTKPSYPYFSLELQGCGNIDKQTSDFILKFDAVQIDNYPMFDLSNDDIIHFNLKCNIINEFGNKSSMVLL